MQKQKTKNWFRQLTRLFISSPPKPRSRPIPQGSCYNLKELFDELKEEYFSNSFDDVSIDWLGKGKTSSKTVVRLGYYSPQKKLIKINRLLDTQNVPRYFIRFIIYHEMLHHIHPPIRSFSGRRRIHHGNFLEEERKFEEYEDSQVFMKGLKKKLFSPEKVSL